MKRISKLIVLFIMLTLVSCDYYDGRLTVINNTGNTICYDYDSDTILDVPSKNKKEFYLSKKLETGVSEKIVLPGSTERWIYEVQKGKDSTLSFFIFEYDKVVSSDWDSLRLIKGYFKRLDFKLKELESLGWVIEFK